MRKMVEGNLLPFQEEKICWNRYLTIKVSDDEPQSLEAAPQLPEQAPPSPDYVSGPEHPPSPDYVPALLLGYVADFDPLEEDLEEDPKEDLAEYPADGGDDDDDDKDEEEASEEAEDKEEEEHLALADYTTLPAIVRSAEDT
ncbi:hypothetical protein Tco_0652256 [Tanacetum coccineum]|uniref:Uncharacterized protein n=1 Tax=Tanacetum coccineum TaxID=301880 RepID=A0ABQ4WX51_9ASTR